MLCHNGILTNRDAIKAKLETKYHSKFEVKSDAHLVIQWVSCKLRKYFSKYKKTEIDLFCIEKLVNSIYTRLEGSFSMILIFRKYGMIALRDQKGLHPLFYGSLKNEEDEAAVEHLIGSETVLFDGPYEEVQPGQCVIFPLQEKMLITIDSFVIQDFATSVDNSDPWLRSYNLVKQKLKNEN